MLCGLLGALPITGVIVRSAANVEAGARTRASAILHGCWLLVFVCLFPFLLRWVPTAALAAILVYTGYKLINPKAIKTLWNYGKSELLIYVVTVVTIVATDLLTGVLVGIGLAAAKLLHTLTSLTIRVHEEPDDNRTVLSLRGAATFLRLPRLAAVLEAVPPNTELHVHFEELSYIDHACLDLLMNWEKQHEATGGNLVVDWESLTARFHSYGEPAQTPGAGVAPGGGTPERNGPVAAPEPAPGSTSH
jgi:MFS superfamily sulfate permease-like transporter